MAIYKNSYSRDEDEALWELHEIRKELHKISKNRTVEDINTEANRKYRSWAEDAVKST